MATRKHAFKRKRTRRTTTRRRRNMVVAISSRDQLPLPNRIRVRHRYCANIYIDATASAASSWTFQLNGLYDPDVTTTGHQPMGYDQFAALYEHYKVVGVRCQLEATGPPSSANSEQYIGMQFHENQSFTPSNIEQIVERGREVHQVLGNQTNRCKLVKYWSAKKWFGKEAYSGGDTAGTVSTNPTEGAFCSVYTTRAENHENPDGLSFLLTLDFIADWYGPLQMNQS